MSLAQEAPHPHLDANRPQFGNWPYDSPQDCAAPQAPGGGRGWPARAPALRSRPADSELPP